MARLSQLRVQLTESGGTVFNVGSGSSSGVDLDVTGYIGKGALITSTPLIKNGSGVMRLDGANTYLIGTIVESGVAFPNWDEGEVEYADGGCLYTLPNPVWGDTIPDPFLLPQGYSPQSAWQTGLWWPYMHANQNSYLCPADVSSQDYARVPTQATGGTGRNNKLSSYVMNGAVNGYVNPPTPICKSADAWSPLCYLMWEPDEYLQSSQYPKGELAEEFNDGASYPSAPPNGAEGIGRLHSKDGGNILAMDGHVDFITIIRFEAISDNNGPGPGGKGLLWWNPHTPNGQVDPGQVYH